MTSSLQFHATSQPGLDAAHDLDGAIAKLLAYCRREDWAGYDPYDALNSKTFKALPFLNSRLPRLIFTQALKRSPINIRPLARIPKTQNPKAIGLFLSALLKLSRREVEDRDELIDSMIERLIRLRSPGSYWCWGYSFPWQGRGILVPSGSANLVCTTFVAGALLDAYEENHQFRCLEMAVSAAEYILNELYWADGVEAGFSYPLPSLRSRVHNANFLAAALFCRIYQQTGEAKFIQPALRAARYSAGRQQPDGSWYYGESKSQRWIDNFHTGYNLVGLKSICQALRTAEFEANIRHGFEFYRTHFFRHDGAARYFHDRTYPLDIHCMAQSILTLVAFRDFDPENQTLLNLVFRWTMDHMWDERGFFYYRALRSCIVRTSYMRWSQAWMLLALATLQGASETADPAVSRDAAIMVS